MFPQVIGSSLLTVTQVPVSGWCTVAGRHLTLWYPYNFQAAMLLQEQIQSGNIVQEEHLSEQNKEELKVGVYFTTKSSITVLI